MAEYKEVRRKANTYFFSKVVINLLLMIIGAIVISVFLRRMQNDTALYKQEQNSRMALEEAVEMLSSNAEDAQDLTVIFHDSSQDMLTDLKELFETGLFQSLVNADDAERAEVFADIVERSGVNYLFLMGSDRKILIAPTLDFIGTDPVKSGMFTAANAEKLLEGTQMEDGTVVPVLQESIYGNYYFYSIPYRYQDIQLAFVLAADAEMLDVQIEALNDLSAVLSHASVGNEGFMFAVDRTDASYLYYNNNGENLTGKNALETGLSEAALEDGYAGLQTINGVRYHCVSKSYGSSTVICAVADTAEIYSKDKYVLFWSVTGFVLVMLMCLSYAVIVRNDFVRRAVDTEKKLFSRRNGDMLIFDISVFKKVFPLMIAGVLLIFSISFYTQTLLEISENIDDSVLALEEVNQRYQESNLNREVIRGYYDQRFLAKTRLMAYLIEEDPSVLNEDTERVYSYYDEDGSRHYLTDDEGNRLRSVPGSQRLQELCDRNDISSIYIYDEDGHTLATNTENWFFTISRDPEGQSYPFLDVLTGKKEILIQDAMTDEFGVNSQYIGVAMDYYTTVDEDGRTVYVGRQAYENYQNAPTDEYGDPAVPVHAHRSMLQIGLDGELSARVMASTDAANILSSDMLSGGFIVLFDSSENKICLYSPVEASIGKTAAEMGVSANAFNGGDYYGFTRVNGGEYFQYFRYNDGYYIGTAIPRSEMYQSRLIIALITSLTSLLLILILSGTVTLMTHEEELLYASMSESESNSRLDAAIFSIVLPSGKRTATMKASARWDNRRIPWEQKSPEQKLVVISTAVFGLLIFYFIVVLIGVDRFFDENSVIQYILRGDWDRGPNVFAFSACFTVLVMTVVAVNIIRLPVRLIASLLGARGETISHLLLSVVKYGGTLGAFFYCLYLIGMDATNLLASAGVLSLVIGLGAQSLIKDILAGIFIVFEGEFRVGDIVTIGGFRGTVMDIGLRTTKIQSGDGNIKIYNNSEISGVLNMTKQASIAVCTIGIEYGQDIEYVEAVLRKELPKLRENNPLILDGPTYLGVNELAGSSVNLSIMCKCNEKDIYGVRRYLNKELLKIFYRNGINIPFPNITVSNLDMSGRKTIADFEEEEKKESNE